MNGVRTEKGKPSPDTNHCHFNKPNILFYNLREMNDYKIHRSTK